jgi:para-aminobenzoate synthetase component 1
MLNKTDAIKQMNEWGASHKAFYFFTDFLGEKVYLTDKKKSQEVLFSFHEGDNVSTSLIPTLLFEKEPCTLNSFEHAFNKVIDHIKYGNSFLTNLTFKTPISTNLLLTEIFHNSRAKYKVLTESFTCFSPETFVKTANGFIYSHPMKGTIDATTPDAEKVILKDQKETAEHVTIVDLIRNDLSQISSEVSVTKFRYIDEVITHEKKLLQVSSEIRGLLPKNWESQLGELLFRLLPAGSITGAPKPQTIEIIQEAESYERGFYTGICGYFDGKNLDTGVMIRFIEQEGDQLYFKSGGGITSFSNLESEYQEMIDKIYVPLY